MATTLLLLFFAGCAQVGGVLTGGPKDKRAPKIDSAGTYPLSGQTNFNEDVVTIRFEEYISLNKPKDNIIITPQLKERPIIKAKNKKLTIEFQEELEANTTYTISFNHAITDITEKNDSVFQYVFSTGSYIDSLKLKGVVKDAFSNNLEEGFLVGLYAVSETQEYDSIPIKEQPIYITQTDKNGVFKLNYLKEGEYYIFAIDDNNKNLKFDQLEKIAFPSSKVVSVNDEKEEYIELLSFVGESDEVKMNNLSFEYPGRLEAVFTNEPKLFDIKSSIELLSEDTGKNDSLVFWLKKPPVSKMQFIVDLEEELDTLKPLYKGVPDTKDETFLQFTTNLQGAKLLPEENLTITFSEPVDKIDFEMISFFDKDSSLLETKNIVIENLRTVVFPTVESNVSSVVIDSGAISSFYQHINREIKLGPFENREQDYYGSLTVNTDSVFLGAVIIQLINNDQEVVTEKPYEASVLFEELLPGKYQLRLIFDENKDGEWTTGSLVDVRLPEAIIYNNELVDVKSKWEKEIDWFLKSQE